MALAVGAASSTVAFGQATTPAPSAAPTSPATPSAAPDFSSIDTDKDGFISRAEASKAGVAGQFTTLDKNNDGRLDRSEFSGMSTTGPSGAAASPPDRGTMTRKN
jgi:hypothetical protein